MEEFVNIRPIWMEVQSACVKQETPGTVNFTGSSINVRAVMEVSDATFSGYEGSLACILIPGGQYVVQGSRINILARIDEAFDTADENIKKKGRGY